MINKKSIIIILGLVVLSTIFIYYFNKPNPGPDVDYTNDKYGFTLTLNDEFNKSVEIKEDGKFIYFVSKEIQATQPGMIFGVVGRIEIYDKAEFTKEAMLEAGSPYGLKYLAENETYYISWAHATDVQTPPGDKSFTTKFRALEKEFEKVIKTIKTKEAMAVTPEVKTDTGRYVGLADNNFFEVKISGVPDNIAARVFMISDKIRTKFENLDLQEGQEIKIKYTPNEHGQNVVEDIERI